MQFFRHIKLGNIQTTITNLAEYKAPAFCNTDFDRFRFTDLRATELNTEYAIIHDRFQN